MVSVATALLTLLQVREMRCHQLNVKSADEVFASYLSLRRGRYVTSEIRQHGDFALRGSCATPGFVRASHSTSVRHLVDIVVFRQSTLRRLVDQTCNPSLPSTG